MPGSLTFDDESDVCAGFLERGWGDGLPIVAPTHARVDSALEAWGRDGDQVLMSVAPSNAELTCRAVVVNSVMAGCLPEHLPYVEAALLAMRDPGYNLHTVQTTTGPIAPLTLVNGPTATTIGMNRGTGAMGPGNHATATIGRAIRLVLVNVGGAHATTWDRASSGLPTKYSWCVPENEVDSPWPPFHTTRGYDAHEDVVTVVGGHGPITVSDSGNVPAEQILTAFASAACAVGTNLWFQRFGQLLLLMSPDHAAIVAEGGYGRADVQEFVIEHARQPVSVLRRSGSYSDERWPSAYRGLGPDATIPLVESAADVLVAVVGGPGPYSHVVPTHGACGRSSSLALRGGHPDLDEQEATS